jgi:polysaccharide export outer membrane protein
LFFALCVLFLTVGCEHRISQTQFIQNYPQAGVKPKPQATQLSPQLQAALDRAMGKYRVGPDDVLTVVVTTSGEAMGPPEVQTRVGPDGQIELPMVGKLDVGGMSLAEAEAAIRDAYVPDYHQQAVVHVEVLQPALTKVLVTGAVVAPGLVELRNNERNLLYSAARAGGLTQASSGVVTVQRLRSGDPPQTFNLTDPADLRRALEQPPLEQGDVITIAAATPNTIFVGGLVNTVSPQVYPPGTDVTVLQAIAAAGGLRNDLYPVEATLIRRIDGEDVFVKLDLDGIARGKAENITLAGGDILWVPHTVWTKLHEIFNNTVYVRAGATFNAGYNVVGADYHHDLKNNDAQTLIVP